MAWPCSITCLYDCACSQCTVAKRCWWAQECKGIATGNTEILTLSGNQAIVVSNRICSISCGCASIVKIVRTEVSCWCACKCSDVEVWMLCLGWVRTWLDPVTWRIVKSTIPGIAWVRSDSPERSDRTCRIVGLCGVGWQIKPSSTTQVTTVLGCSRGARAYHYKTCSTRNCDSGRWTKELLVVCEGRSHFERDRLYTTSRVQVERSRCRATSNHLLSAWPGIPVCLHNYIGRESAVAACRV